MPARPRDTPRYVLENLVDAAPSASTGAPWEDCMTILGLRAGQAAQVLQYLVSWRATEGLLQVLCAGSWGATGAHAL